MHKILVTAVAMILALVCTQPEETRIIPEEVKKEIKLLLVTREDAVVENDITLFKSTITDDAVGTSVSGYMKLSFIEIKLLALDYVSEDDENKLIGFVKETMTKESGKSPYTVHSLHIFEKVDGRWLISRVIFDK